MPGENFPKTHSSNRLKSVAFYSFHSDDALSVLRMYGPANAAGLGVIRGVVSGNVIFDAVNEADLVIIQRDFCKDYASYLKIISQTHSQNKPVILDLDDNLFVLPEDHPDRLIGYYTDSLLPTFQAVKDVDLITVATKPLREYLLPFNKNVKVLPNYLDDKLWKLTMQAAHDGDKIIIGYMGGQTHQPDLQMLVPVLARLLEKYPDRIQFHFWGIEAPAEVTSCSKVDWYPPVFFRYDEFAFAFQTQKADLLIAPLCDNLFNSCKSAIKYLEYGAIGLPGVYSRVAPYIDIVENGKDGLLASTLDDWMDELVRLIESPELRRELASNAQDKIRNHWLLSKNVEKRIKIYQDAITKYHPKERVPSSFDSLEKSITQQYYEGYSIKNNQLKSLKVQMADRDENNRSLNQQLALQDENNRSLNQQLALQDENNRSLNQQLALQDENNRSLNQQLALQDENNRSLNQQVAVMDDNIHTLDHQIVVDVEHINDLQNEVISYATSHSWKLTRPLRGFMRLISRLKHA